MVLFDFNQLIIRNLMVICKDDPNLINQDEITIPLVIEKVCREIASFRKSHAIDTPEVYLIGDSEKKYIKTKIFKYYKHDRNTKSAEYINKIWDIFRQTCPYKMYKIDHLEADDIISYMCRNKNIQGTIQLAVVKRLIIYSNDSDFNVFLQAKYNCAQYSPLKKNFIASNSVALRAFEKILKGDISDGVPNIISNGDCFVSGKRQTTLKADVIFNIVKDYNQSSSVIESCLANVKSIPKHKLLKNIIRNKLCLDIQNPPKYIDKKIENHIRYHLRHLNTPDVVNEILTRKKIKLRYGDF